MLQQAIDRDPVDRIDRYPTRTAEPAPHIERLDPTVWGEVHSEQLSTFDRDGFSIMENLLSPEEVSEFRAEVERLAADKSLLDDERVIREKTSNRVRSVFEVHKLSAAVADLVRQTRIVGLARQVLGSDVYLHQTRINYMPGFRGTGFYWHSDFETWHAEDGMPAPRAVSLSIALTDNYPFNGSLMVMPGSHRTFVPCVGATPADHYRESLREQEIGVPSTEDITVLAQRYGITQFTGRAGSALLFDSNIMHGSANNITPFPRSNIFLVFNSVENTLVEPFAAPAPRPTYIGSRDFTPL
ncbi:MULTISPECIES: ectoine hydroxylase [Nocardia]|uniref:ectoine hydroxylase n=1 Tax=Nocardia TaxID=1817 RepID=UPI0015627A8C|nr:MULTISPECIES: ectoine hydroxylase [Nocardia]MBF6067444.1 ectoine hydroxylase [Nocardia farcinica]MBF6139845.1 ectoine hydroxylase [Nocardia farcinica]MBF6184241.1 ectoine hydroxylase [Nocardia farcinica]MBF6256045.1 ectoine hydroxylase [Nocardia farcinica]MBF6267230.1 ectoine hydroxylase [Nocardia farcinica]